MPVFSCGGMRFQASWRERGQEISPEAQSRLAATVDRALELGVRHIETARGYGTSERQLGMVLPQYDRDRYILQTKIAPHPDPAVFAEHVEESFRRLRVQRLDLLALHGVNTFEKLHWAIRPGGCLHAARRLVAQGRVGAVGLSTHGATPMIEAAIAHEADGGFDYVNLHWYYIQQHNWSAVRAAHERDMGVFIISPADKGGRLYDPPDRLVELCRPLHPLVFNAAFCLSRPEVHTLSIGAAGPGDFDLALQALPVLDGDGQQVRRIEQRLDEAMRHALGAAVGDRLLDGLPEWFEMPGYINVRVILWLRALVLAFGVELFARGRYNLLGNGGDWFPGNGAAALAGPDPDPALVAAVGKAVAASPFADQIPHWLREAHRMLGGAAVSRLSQG